MQKVESDPTNVRQANSMIDSKWPPPPKHPAIGAATVSAAPSTASVGQARRPNWDLKGKLSDMEAKIRRYQNRMKTVSQENEELKDTVAQNQLREEDIAAELKELHQHISTFKEELSALSGVKHQLEEVTTEKASLENSLASLTAKHRVQQGLRDGLETKLQGLQGQFSVESSSLSLCQTRLQETQERALALVEMVAHQREQLHTGEMERNRLQNNIQELQAVCHPPTPGSHCNI